MALNRGSENKKAILIHFLVNRKTPIAVNIKAAIGIRLKDILEYYQIEKSESYRVIMGGPMMGIPLDSIELSTMKTTSGLLINKPKFYKEHPCVVCGKCVDACPVNLVPQRLNRFFDGKDWGKIEDEGLRDCMECGCCTYTCPSRIPLTYKFKTAKTMV